MGAAATAATPALADVPQSLSAYVKARAADGDGAVDVAASAYAKALAASPDNPIVAIRAYRDALAAGDMALARSSSQVLERSGLAPADTALLATADAITAEDWERTNAAADRMASGPLDFMAPVIKAWVAFERGDKDAARLLDNVSKSALARRFSAENRAYLMVAGGDEDRGIAEIRTLLTANPGSLDLRVNAAQLLARQGRRDTALALIAGSDPMLSALRAQLKKPPQAGVAFGVSRLFTRLASDLIRGEARPLAIALARSAALIDPGDDRSRLILADALSANGASDRAVALLDGVKPGSIYYQSALATKVTALTRAGRATRALDVAKAVSAAPGATSGDAQRLGDLLFTAGRFDDSAAAYATAIARAGANPGWILYLQRGGALEQAGRWSEAEALLERAVALAPDEALALNSLAYARIERGEQIAESQGLLEKAVTLEPDDPSIADSLGWAYLRGGQLGKALPLLERAARAQPADVEIQEHLGDAYWQSGRRIEARYAWRAASVYAGDVDASRLTGKVARGLP